MSFAMFTQRSVAATLEQYRDIVIAKNAPAPVRDAAADLQYHLQKIAGREFPLASEKSGGLHFYVGSGFHPELDARAAKLENEGWLIASVPDGVLLTGSHEDSAKLAGVYHAVSLFLEEQAGVRWLWPGESGEVIPHNPDLEISQIERSGVPDFRRRQLMAGYVRFWAPEQRAEWNAWTKRTRQGDQLNAVFGHAWASIIPPEQYFEAHPEWFSLVNGKRITAQLCISNPQLRDEFVKNLLAKPGNQKLDIISVSANDGFGFCQCDRCGNIADAYWDFVNDIAQRVKVLRPEVGVGTFAYSFSRQPPKNIEKLPDNVYLSMTSYATQLMLPEGRQEYEEFMNGWKSKGVKIVMREYWGVHYYMDLPVLFPRETGEEVRMGYEAGLMGAYGETGKNFATQAPNYYVLTHQLWNPEADPEVALDEFYAAFGPAKEDVRRYYETLSDSVHRAWREKKLTTGLIPLINSYDEMFDPRTLSAAWAALNAADRAAEGNPDLQKKLAFIRHGYEYTALMAKLIGVYKKLGRSGFPLEFFEYQSTAAQGRRVFQNPDFENNLEFYENLRKQPFQFTIKEQNQWLKEAWELGQERLRMLNASRHDFSLNEGLYAQTLEANIRQWHQTVGKYLGKPESEIIELEYTHPARKAAD